MKKRLSDARDVSWHVRCCAGLLALGCVFVIAGCSPDSVDTAVLPVQEATPDRTPPAGRVAVNVVNASDYLAGVQVDYFINDALVHHAEAVLASASGGDPNISLCLDFDEADRVVVDVQVLDSAGQALWSDQKTYLLGEDFQDQDTIEYTIIYPRTPVAIIQAPAAAHSGQAVLLDGSASYSPLGLPLTYEWQQVPQPTVELTGADAAIASFTAPPVEIPTDMVFRLTVSDGTNSDSEEATITVSPNQAPVAMAIATPNPADSGVLVTLDGTGSYDPDGDTIVSYVWEQLPGGAPVTLSSTTDPVVTFTAPPAIFVIDAPGPGDASGIVGSLTLSFRLTVYDQSLSGSTQVDVVVQLVAPNRPPVASLLSGYARASGQFVPLDASGSWDPDLDPLSYQFRQVSGTTADGLDPSITDSPFVFVIAPSVNVPETAVFEVTVFDGQGGSDTATASVIFLPSYSPPVAVAEALPDTPPRGSLVTLDGSASIVTPGLSLTYQWRQLNSPPDPAVVLSATDQASVTFTAPTVVPASGTLTFELTVDDGVDSDYTTVTVYLNQAPVAASAPICPALIGWTVTLDASGSYDPDDDPITYSWEQVIPPGPAVTLSATDQAIVTFTVPGTVNPPQWLWFHLTVTDTWGASNIIDVGVNIISSYQPPYCYPHAIPNNAIAGTQVTLDASWSQGCILSYQWQQLNSPPDPAVVLSATDQESVTFTAPEVASPTTLTFQLTVSDGTTPVSATVGVYVMPSGTGNIPPVAIPVSISQALVGETVTLYGSGSFDPDGGPLTYQWQQLFGTLMTLSATDQADVSFVVPDTIVPGEGLMFRLTVFDSQLFAQSAEVMLVVQDAGYAGNKPPILMAAANPDTAYEGQTVTLDSSATDVDLDEPAINWLQYWGTPVVFDTAVSGVWPGGAAVGYTFVVPTIATRADERRMFMVVANDPAGQTDSQPVLVTLRMMGDVNGDGSVDATDVDIMTVALGTFPIPPPFNPLLDLNQDTVIDDADMALIVANLGRAIVP